jgi:hypothetical protein
MLRYALPVAAALTLGASAAFAQTAIGQPMPPNPQINPMTTNTSAPGTMGGTITGQPLPGPNDYYGMQPPPIGMAPMPVVPVPPNAVWIPGHYNWDPNAQYYVWLDGEFAQPPRPGAQWMPGHWEETPTAWVWVDGRWS